MTDLQAIDFLLAQYDGKTALLARALRCNNQQNVTNWRGRKAISPGFRLPVLKLLQKFGAEVDALEWLGRATRRRVEPVKPRKDKTNGRTRHAAKAGQRNRKRQKPKSGKATARKSGKAGAQRAAV